MKSLAESFCKTCIDIATHSQLRDIIARWCVETNGKTFIEPLKSQIETRIIASVTTRTYAILCALNPAEDEAVVMVVSTTR